jgi:hypothetical protein
LIEAPVRELHARDLKENLKFEYWIF